MQESERFYSLARRLLLAAVGILAAILAFRLLFDWLLPFSIAFFASFLLYPLSRRLGKRTGMSHAVLRIFLLFLLVTGVSLLLFFGAVRLVREVKEFFLSFYDNFDTLASTVLDWIDGLKEKLPLSEDIPTDTISSILQESVKNAMASLSAKSAEGAAKLAAKLPSMLFALFMFLIALFYFTLDYERVTAYLASLVPRRHHEKLAKLKAAVNSALKGYFRAYFVLFLITFLLLWIAFLGLGVDYAFLLALTAAALDSLPAIGIGILLIPWSIFLLIRGNTVRALVILGIYLGITLLRRAIEPRILGRALGMHPLLSLAALYVGFRFFGFLGILLSPLAALALAKLVEYYRHTLQSETG